jgi:hypothetical protein
MDVSDQPGNEGGATDPRAKAIPSVRGRGSWKGKVHFYAGWDSRDENKRIEELFETRHEAGSE